MFNFDGEPPAIGALYPDKFSVHKEEAKELLGFAKEANRKADELLNSLPKPAAGEEPSWIPNRHILSNPNGKNKIYFSENLTSLKSFMSRRMSEGDVAIIGAKVYEHIDGKFEQLVTSDNDDEGMVSEIWHEEEMDGAYEEGKEEGWNEGFTAGAQEGYEKGYEAAKEELGDSEDVPFLEQLEREADDGTLNLHRYSITTWDHKSDKDKKLLCVENSCSHRTYFIEYEDHNSILLDYKGFDKGDLGDEDIVVNLYGLSRYWKTDDKTGRGYFGSIKQSECE